MTNAHLILGHLRAWVRERQGDEYPHSLITSRSNDAGLEIIDAADLQSLAERMDAAGLQTFTPQLLRDVAPEVAGAVDALEAVGASPAFLPEEVLEAIWAQVPDWGVTDAQAAAILNAPDPVTYPPPPAAVRRRTLSMARLSAALDQAARAAVVQHARFDRMLEAVQRNDHAAVSLWVQVFVDDETITPAAAGAVMAIVQETEPVPGHPAATPRSWAEVHLGHFVSAAEIAAAREA